MIFRKTHNTKKKKVLRGKFDTKKESALYRVYTYWFLFIPVYQYEEFIE
tara:strand:- start:8376 stop:8522 length:147 start_codon:yes stop_codon:yes gene_type:complete